MATYLTTTGTGVRVSVDDSKVDGLLASGHYVREGDGAPEAAPDSGAPKGNASRDEWAAYADSLGVEYDEGAGREDIKSAVENR
jgi:hypothetical protein